jgi:hypothetical protein
MSIVLMLMGSCFMPMSSTIGSEGKKKTKTEPEKPAA